MVYHAPMQPEPPVHRANFEKAPAALKADLGQRYRTLNLLIGQGFQKGTCLATLKN